MKSRIRPLYSGLIALAALTLAVGSAHAQDVTWSNNAGTGAWNTTDGNWFDGVVHTTFTPGDEVEFTNTAAGSVVIDAGGVAPGLTTFSSSSNYTFTGGNVTSGNVVLNGSGTILFDGYNVSLGFGILTVNNGTFRYRDSSLANNSVISVGSGTITLDHGGRFMFSHGQGSDPGVEVTNDFVIGAGGGIINTDRRTGNPRTVFSGTVTLGGDLLLSKGGGGNSEPSQTYTGVITITGADRAIRGHSDFSNGAFPQILGDIVEDVAGRQLTLAMATSGRQFIIGGTGNNWTGGTVIESGAGFIRVLSGSSLGTGDVEIQSGGQLRIEGSGNIGAAATVSVASGAVIGYGYAPTSTDLDKLALVAGSGIALGVNTSTDVNFSAGGLNADARLGAYANMTYSGTITPFSDTYRLGVTGAGGIMTLNQTNALTGARDLDVAGGGVVHLGAANDFTGTTTVGPGGTLRIGHADAIQNTPSITLAGGQIRPTEGGTTTIGVPVLVTANSTIAGNHNNSVLTFDNTVTLNANLSIPGANSSLPRGTYIFNDVISGTGQLQIGRGNKHLRQFPGAPR